MYSAKRLVECRVSMLRDYFLFYRKTSCLYVKSVLQVGKGSVFYVYSTRCQQSVCWKYYPGVSSQYVEHIHEGVSNLYGIHQTYRLLTPGAYTSQYAGSIPQGLYCQVPSGQFVDCVQLRDSIQVKLSANSVYSIEALSVSNLDVYH